MTKSEQELLKKYKELSEVVDRKTRFIEENGLTIEYLKWVEREKREKKNGRI